MKMELSLDETMEELAKREAGILTTIWFALAASVGVYVVVGSMLAGSNDPVALQRAQVQLGQFEVSLVVVRWAFILLGLALLAGAAWVARTYLSDGNVIANASGDTQEARMTSGFAYLRRYSFIAWGLAEGVILAGTLLAILSGRSVDLLPFAIAGGTGLFLLKPEVPSLVELAEKMAGAPATG